METHASKSCHSLLSLSCRTKLNSRVESSRVDDDGESVGLNEARRRRRTLSLSLPVSAFAIAIAVSEYMPASSKALSPGKEEEERGNEDSLLPMLHHHHHHHHHH